MAQQKGRGSRGSSGGTRGGFRPPELRGTLGTLLRTTLQQAGAVRDAAANVARDVLERSAREGRSRVDSRKRHDALAELGEIVLQLIRDGEIDVAELPEAAEIVRHLDDLDDVEGSSGEPADEDFASPPSRRRFDDRSDDGTVSSARWTPPKTPSSERVWRPPSAPAPERDEAATVPPPTRKGALPRKGGGGIRFDDDDSDLADYMHPDDVPPKKDE